MSVPKLRYRQGFCRGLESLKVELSGKKSASLESIPLRERQEARGKRQKAKVSYKSVSAYANVLTKMRSAIDQGLVDRESVNSSSSVPATFVPVRFAPLKSAPVRSVPLRSAPVRSAPENLASLRLAPRR